MGRKGGLSTTDKSGGERAAEEGIDIDDSRYRTRSRSPKSLMRLCLPMSSLVGFIEL